MNISIKVAALVVRGKRVLIIKEWSKKRQNYFWNTIKGTYDSNKDDSPIKTAIREAREEICLPVSVIGLMSIFVLRKGEDTTVQFNFYCRPVRNSDPKLRKKYEKDEDIVEFRWVSKKDFQKMNPQSLFSKRTHDILFDYFRNGKKFPTTIFKDINEFH